MKKIMKRIKKVLNNEKGIGVYEIIGVAAVMIIAAFVIIPGLRSFAESIMESLGTWYDNTISTKLFPTH